MGRKTASASSGAGDGGQELDMGAMGMPGGCMMDPAAAMAAVGGQCMMNPMMAGMNPMMMMMNPMMMANMNPMMAMMMGGMCGMPGGMPCGMGGGMPGGMPGAAPGAMPGAGMPAAAPGAASAQASGNQAAEGPTVDPQIRDLCKTFNIEDRLMQKLHRVMMRRPESFDEDIQTLWERLGEPRADIGVLITQLEKGLFVSIGCMPKDMVVLVKKYSLDDRASQRLAESMMKRKDTMKDDLKDLDVRLASAERPSGLLMTLLQGLDTTGKLPAPPRSLGLPSGYRAVGGHEPADREDDRDRGRRDRDRRERSRDRDRERSRSRRRR